MRVLAIADSRLQEELLEGASNLSLTITWVSKVSEIQDASGYDVCLDLLFENTVERISALKQCQPALIVINSVIDTLQETSKEFVRFNGWPGFLKRPVVEASCHNESLKKKAEELFAGFGKRVEWVPDIPGFLSARVIATIVNEAYFALEEAVSSKSEIDTAMKLGTNYPYGPFEWCEKTGIRNFYKLLSRLAPGEKRYTPADLLTKEANP